MIPIKEYFCENIPTEKEIKRAYEIANENMCMVNLKWFVSYNGWNERYIHPNSNLDEVMNSIKNTVYAI